MTYTVYFTDREKNAITVANNSIDSSTGIKLVGQGYNNYGEHIAENLLHLLENFAGETIPPTPVEGQLWYNNNTKELKYFDNVQNGHWKSVASMTVQNNPPSSVGEEDGHLWLNDSNGELSLYYNGNWVAIAGSGPTVTTEKLVDNSITTAKIINNAITEEKIINNAITTSKIADNSITEIKIANHAFSARNLSPITPTGATSASDIADLIRRTGLTPFDFGAQVSDTNHSPAINALVAHMSGNNVGGVAYLPPIPGGWKIGSPIRMHSANVNSRTHLVGLGNYVPVIWLNSSPNVFVIGDGVNEKHDIAISGIQIIGEADKTNGVAVYIRKASNVRIKDISIQRSYNGFYAEYVNDLTMDDFEIQSTDGGSYGFRFYADPASGKNLNIKCNNIRCQGQFNARRGIEIVGDVYDISINNSYTLGYTDGLFVESVNTNDETTNSGIPNNVWISNFVNGYSSNRGINLRNGKNITFDRCHLVNTTGGVGQGGNDFSAVTVTENVELLRILNSYIGECRYSAINVAGKSVYIIDNHFISAAQGSDINYSLYCSSTARDVHIHRNRFDGKQHSTHAVHADSTDVTGSIRDNSYLNQETGFSDGIGAGMPQENNIALT